MEKFVSPCAPPEGYVRELLTILVEECAEVQQRATKALRFGVGEVQPGQALNNIERLSLEVGDLLEVLDSLEGEGALSPAHIDEGQANKRRQLDRYMQARPTPASDAEAGS